MFGVEPWAEQFALKVIGFFNKHAKYELMKAF